MMSRLKVRVKIAAFARQLSIAVVVYFTCALLVAQQPDIPPQAQTPADSGGVPATLMQASEPSPNYVNYYAFVNGIFDYASALPSLSTSAIHGTSVQGGGGISANHVFSTGFFSLGYRGSYRTDADPQYPSGTDQSLDFTLRKAFTRRLAFTLQQNAGIYPLGSTFVQPASTTQNGAIQTTPFALKTKFSGTTLSAAYMQTLRLSYEFTGTYSLLRYNAPVGYGNSNLGGSASMLYRLTRATTLSGTYQFNEFLYQHKAGSAASNTLYLTLSHNLSRYWSVGVSAGATRTSASGTTLVPVDFQIGTEVVPVVLQQHYSQKTILPYAQATITHNWRRTILSVNGGEGVNPGNGFFLASRNIGINAVFSYSAPRWNVSAGGYFSRLTSVAYASSNKVSTADFEASGAYNLLRHLGVNLRYDYIRYGDVGAYSGRFDNRVTFGLYFSSKSIPLAIF